MGQIIVGNLDDRLISTLQSRAERHGWTLEQELRDILERAVTPPWEQLLADLDQARASTPPGARRLAEDLVREDRDSR